VISVVVDPNNPQFVYAASDLSGVWKSTDAAHTWKQAVTGLLNGTSVGSDAFHTHPLAIDGTNSQRLIYASTDDDLRVGTPDAGLYVSINSAGSWTHPNLPCQPEGLTGVAFSQGRAFALTRCGLATSTDLSNWTLTTATAPFIGGSLAVSGQTIFGCAGNQVYRSTDLGATWSAGVSLSQGCYDITTAPDNPTGKALVVTGYPADALVVDFTQQPPVATSLNLTSMNAGAASGIGSIAAAPLPGAPSGQGPGVSYDLLVGSGQTFYQYLPGSNPPWSAVPNGVGPPAGIHIDTWGLAFPPNYNPGSGNCTVYLATDGGVFANLHGSGTACQTSQGPWGRAQSGFHARYNFSLAGVSQAPCGSQPHACPALYLPSGDNGTWGSLDGGQTWNDMGCCGDSGTAVVDPGLPTRMVTLRNADRQLYVSSTSSPPAKSDNKGNFWANNMSDGPSSPPGQAAFSQVMTLQGESPSPNGDYFGLVSAAGSNDAIVRTTNPTSTSVGGVTWTSGSTCLTGSFASTEIGQTLAAYQGNGQVANGLPPLARITAVGGTGNPCVSPNATINAPTTATQASAVTVTLSHWTIPPVSTFFSQGQVGAITTAGGHSSTTVYVLSNPNQPTAPGHIFKGQVNDSTGTISSFTDISSGITKAYALFADPYDTKVLYAYDFGATQPDVKMTTNGGASWVEDPVLTVMATRWGEFRPFCGWPGNPVITNPNLRRTAYQCSLNDVVFVRGHPEIRIAVFSDGLIAFSRDAGAHWINLVGATNAIDAPYSAFYDTVNNPQTGAPSLYVDLTGHSLIRIDTPFPTLQGINLSLNGLLPGNTAAMVDDTTGITTPLVRTSDGVYRATELIDSATTPTIKYHLVIDGIASVQFTHTLSPADISAGVVDLTHTLTMNYTGDTTADYHDSALLAAELDLSSTPLVGAPVSLSLGTQGCQRLTDATGQAACNPITITQVPGHYVVTATFGGNGAPVAITTSQPFTITREETTTTYTGPTVILAGQPVDLSGKLLEDGVTPIPGRTLTLSVGGQACTTGFTDSTGSASCSPTANVALGPEPLTASFLGDAYYLPSSDTSKTAIVFAFPSRGAFTLGDRTTAVATPASTVTWWAAQWSRLNSLSGGSAPPSFKGFARTVSLPGSTPPSACGSNWVTTTGNSPPPTRTVPSYMGVLVTSNVSQSGSSVSGNTLHIVIVRVRPGYAPNPGHDGTGTVVATFC
jgi:hypothetical protein